MQHLQSLYPASSASDNVSNVPIVSGAKPRMLSALFLLALLAGMLRLLVLALVPAQ